MTVVSGVVTAPESFALIIAKEPNDPTAVKSPRLNARRSIKPSRR